MRCVLLGMNNPVSSDPAHALFPHPPGCSGHRLLTMLQEVCPEVTRGQYIRGFDRRNVLGDKRWSRAAGRASGAGVRDCLLNEAGSADEGSLVVVVFGQDAWRALDLPEHWEPVLPHREGRVVWRRLPHPSGRNHWYNEPDNRLVAGLLLEELLLG